MHRNAVARRVAKRLRRCGSLAASGMLAGAALLISGPAAGVANAEGVNWDAVAECESGGDWEADTGNGFYGGLQFKKSTWNEFGGKGSPAKASRADQIAVANRVLAKQGPGAWPKCGPAKMHAPAGTTMPRPLHDLLKTLWGSLAP